MTVDVIAESKFLVFFPQFRLRQEIKDEICRRVGDRRAKKMKRKFILNHFFIIILRETFIQDNSATPWITFRSEDLAVTRHTLNRR